MSTNCSRCGRYGENEYGTDGLTYCSSCIFYGINKPCFKCRMYLPASELQQYKGAWVCPYCVQDMRDEDRRSEYHPPKEPVSVLSYPETCERCGRDLDRRVYIWNNKKLCKRCVEDEQDKWSLVTGKPGGTGQGISVLPIERAKKKSLIESFISEVLVLLRLKSRETTRFSVPKTKMPITHAKPLSEPRLMKKEDKSAPVAEDIMKVRRNTRAKIKKETK